MKILRLLPALLVVIGVGLLTTIAASTSVHTDRPTFPADEVSNIESTAARTDEQMQAFWRDKELTPAPPADDLQVLRRLSLALHGTIPSLEEIRRFEADTQPHRLSRWTAAMLEDTRFADYFAERLARAFVGVEQGQFIVFRRDRFTEWLRRQLKDRRPYDEIVRAMITGRGVWTGQGEVNFITAGFANEVLDENKLTARTVRAFLGQRIDCAQCHDHPFDDWTQAQFDGLAAHFGQVQLSLAGIHDQTGFLFDLSTEAANEFSTAAVSESLRTRFRDSEYKLPTEARIEPLAADGLWAVKTADQAGQELQPRFVIRRVADRLTVSNFDGEYLVEDRESLDQKFIEPSVPFHPEWFGNSGTRRDRLAAWVTHPENRRFERAIVNRVWGLVFGQPLLMDRPVDDLPSPDEDEATLQTAVLNELAHDFRAHGCSLHRLIQVIAATRSFRMDSRFPASRSASIEEAGRSWAVFPITRRRPEQVIGAMLQANSVKTIDQNSHLFVRFRRFVSEQDFVEEYGDLGEHELQDRAETISQALLRMNGQFAEEMSVEEAFSAPGRISSYSSTPEKVLENCFLVCLTRRPRPEEVAHFLPQLKAGNGDTEGVVADIFWALFNSPEF